MKYKYRLPDIWVKKVSFMEEFANGAMQVTVRLKSGRVVPQVLVSDGTYVIAVRGAADLPFALADIDDIYQNDGDKNPVERGGWQYWDDWPS